MRTRFTMAASLAMVVLAPFALFACGGDDDDSDEGGSAGAEDHTEWCDASLALETVPEPEVDFESMTPEEQAEFAKEWATTEFRPLVDVAVAAAPDEIADDVATMDGVVRELEDTGDFSVFEDPEVDGTTDRLHAFDLANCGWHQIDVTATNYAFAGIPDTLEAGATSFEFANDGTELHEIVVFRINDGVTETVEELLDLPEDEVMLKVTFVTATGSEPGGSEYAVADLEAGNHAALCFIPVGATSEEEAETADGPPHFVEGMVTEFTVG